MRISVSDAKKHLTELVRKAEAGEEVVLTRHGQAAVRLVPVSPRPDPAARRRLIAAIRAAGAAKAAPGPSAARSQDALYGDDGLPGSGDDGLPGSGDDGLPGSGEDGLPAHDDDDGLPAVGDDGR